MYFSSTSVMYTGMFMVTLYVAWCTLKDDVICGYHIRMNNASRKKKRAERYSHVKQNSQVSPWKIWIPAEDLTR